ncbi:hypothetical protein CL644_01960 [bacterium]|nr:hypothetical protein [bacterium]
MHQLCKKYSWQDIMSLQLNNHTILLDIDGVLMAHGEDIISPIILKNIEMLRKNNDIYIVSNSLSTHRIIKTSTALKIPWVDSGLKKPSIRILSFIKYDKTKPLVVIGDKILTDGLFAYRINAKALLLNRRVSQKDPLVVRVTYLIDDTIYSLCKFFFAR